MIPISIIRNRETCPSRVWWTLEMVGLTIWYKSDSLTTIAITRFQRQHHLKHNSPKTWETKPIYIGPFNISNNMSLVTYRLELPLELSSLHNHSTFQFTSLRDRWKYNKDYYTFKFTSLRTKLWNNKEFFFYKSEFLVPYEPESFISKPLSY